MLVYLLFTLKKAGTDWRTRLTYISYVLVYGLWACALGKVIKVSHDTEFLLFMSYLGIFAVMNYPTHKAMWEQHKVIKAAQAAERRAQAQEPTPTPERIGNR